MESELSEGGESDLVNRPIDRWIVLLEPWDSEDDVVVTQSSEVVGE